MEKEIHSLKVVLYSLTAVAILFSEGHNLRYHAEFVVVNPIGYPAAVTVKLNDNLKIMDMLILFAAFFDLV